MTRRAAPRDSRGRAGVPPAAARGAVALLGLLIGLGGPSRAAAQEPIAPRDSLERFLEGLADTTDRFFGISAARPDTAGFDSALAWALANPRSYRPRRRVELYPTFSFNRADGPVWGGAASVDAGVVGDLDGGARYAAGPDDWLWRAGWRRSFEGPTGPWSAHVKGERATDVVDPERALSRLATLRALVSGQDSRHYYRREGIEVGLAREATTWRAGATYRDMVEGPLATTTSWNLMSNEPSVFENLPAAAGRARELSYDLAWHVPFAPVTAEVQYATAGEAIDSEFEYRRTRIAASGEVPIGRIASLIPQATYGRVTGRMIPQVAFYLGGAHTLRSMRTSSIGGSGMALARLDLIGAPDLLELAHVPHPAAFPLQGALFGAIGAVWGEDPYGGSPRPGVDWPRRGAWRSEAGVTLIWQPGIPDPGSFFRLSFAQPIGPEHPGRTRWTITYTHALDLVKRLASVQ